MKSVRIYQVVDEVSEGVISTFVAPNSRYAVREFNKMLSDPKIKDSIDPNDFSLVCSEKVSICESFNDSVNMFYVDEVGAITDCDGDVIEGGTV